MKKIFILAMAALLSATAVSAQDMAEATSTAQAAKAALETGDLTKALEGFESALTMAELCGGEGEDLAYTCKDVIPTIMLSIGKDYLKNSRYAEAIDYLSKTAARAQELQNTGVANEAEKLIPQIYTQEAGELLKAKNFEGAIAKYQKVLELDPKNGRTHMMIGMAYQALNKVEEAEAAYKAAIENGQGKQASKRVSNMMLRLAQDSIKDGKFQEAIDFAKKSNEYMKNSAAYKFAANAAIKMEHLDEAIGYFEEYLSVTPKAKDKNDVLYSIGALYQKAGNNAKAKEYYGQLTADPKYGESVKALINSL